MFQDRVWCRWENIGGRYKSIQAFFQCWDQFASFSPPCTLKKKIMVSITCTTHDWLSCKKPKYAKKARPCLGFSFVKGLALLPCTYEMVQIGCSQGWLITCFHIGKYSAFSPFKPSLLAALSNSSVVSKTGSLEYSVKPLIWKFLALGYAFWFLSMWSIYTGKPKISHRVK